MSDDRGLAQSSKRDCCSWVIIFRSFRIAIAFPILLLAALGAVLTPLGWRLSEVIFVGDELKPVLANTIERNNRLPGERPPKNQPGTDSRLYSTPAPEGSEPIASLVTAVGHNANGFPGVTYHRFVEPFRELFQVQKGWARFAYFLFGGLWTVLVWGLFGGAITRIAIMQLGCDERISMREGMEHAMRKFTSYFTSPLLPIAGVLLCAIPIAILGLIMKTDFGVIIGGIFWLLALLAGFVMALLLLGLLFGWPLMWATLSAEGTDSFDALSRSYAYTFQRPLKYLGYVIVAILFGALTWWLVYFFSETVVQIAYWGAHWGTGFERMGEIAAVTEGGMEAEGVLGVGAFIIKVCVHVIRTFATAFSYSFFWVAMCAIYLLLRRDVDQTEFDEIFVQDDEERFGLPKMKPDEAGVPGVADKPAEKTEEPAKEPESKPEQAEEQPAETPEESGEPEQEDKTQDTASGEGGEVPEAEKSDEEADEDKKDRSWE